MSENIQENLKNWLASAKITKPRKKARSNKLDKVFGNSKKDILELFTINKYQMAQVYNDLSEMQIIENITYRAFCNWVKKNLENDSNIVHIESENIRNVFEKKSVTADANNSINVSCEFQPDSREIFFGFDMNNEPDPLTNPVPKLNEISHEYIFNIFKNDTSLNNEKIVYILLFEIRERNYNMYKEIWNFMLIKNDESIQQYYDRLQDVINSDENYCFGITNATASISDIAFACGCDKYKIIRSNVK